MNEILLIQKKKRKLNLLETMEYSYIYALAIKKWKHWHTQDNKTIWYCFWWPDSEYVVLNKILHWFRFGFDKNNSKYENKYSLIINISAVLYPINVNI